MRNQTDVRLGEFVERGRFTDVEVRDIVARTRVSTHLGPSLRGRPWLTVSLPGGVIERLGGDVVFGVPRAVMDDQVIRKVARGCPEAWVDGRWYPADVQGIHLVLATTITVVAPDGIPSDVASLLDVPADEVRFAHDRQSGDLRFVRLSWKPGRAG